MLLVGHSCLCLSRLNQMRGLQGWGGAAYTWLHSCADITSRWTWMLLWRVTRACVMVTEALDIS
jgi:hypothetical protein